MDDEIIIASAGSGKTTMMVDEAIKNKDKILILTYTRDNLSEIKDKFIRLNDVVPANLTIKTWFSFLLNDCARPYQNFLYDKRIKTVHFANKRSAFYASKSDIENYYFNSSGAIYSDKIAGFVCECDDKSEGLVIKRLEEIYDYIYIDEVQDLADSLYPDLPETNSLNEEVTEHDGIYTIKKENVEDYIREFSPKILRYSRKTKLFRDKAMNFGQAKGLNFDRVLILPNKPIKKFLKTGDIKKVKKSRAKFYVALTRARYSVAFLYDDEVNLEGIEGYEV